MDISIEGVAPGWLRASRVIIYWLCMLCAIIAGITLVQSIFIIRQFYDQQDATSSMDFPMLLRHSLAFGIFLVFTIIMAVGAIFNEIDDKYLDVFRVLITVNVVAQFVS